MIAISKKVAIVSNRVLIFRFGDQAKEYSESDKVILYNLWDCPIQEMEFSCIRYNLIWYKPR